MKIFLLKAIVFSVILLNYSVGTAQDLDWANAMGGTDYDSGNSISTDALGNIYITGSFSGTADFDPSASTYNLTSAGSGDIFIQKLDASGNFVWAKVMGETYDDIGYSISTDASGNSYITGYFFETVDFDPSEGTYNLISVGARDIFIQKLDASGNFVWAKAMGGTYYDGGSF
ncbi:MAG TPA: SBBP repeat-containing protein, partial [Bacteroidales bacterium]|nr:SBBP repeat-containing protein [Bacteroidales bacterium]